jgi:hypothetical protein
MLMSSSIFEDPPISVLTFLFIFPPRFKWKLELGLFHISKTWNFNFGTFFWTQKPSCLVWKTNPIPCTYYTFPKIVYYRVLQQIDSRVCIGTSTSN